MLIKGKRRGLSAEQKAGLWKRWKAGQSLNEIGRALGKDHVVVHFVLARHGGIAPPTGRRSRRVLTLAEREDISRGIASGCAMRVIARGLHRSPSTISREITPHGGRTVSRQRSRSAGLGVSRAVQAHARYTLNRCTKRERSECVTILYITRSLDHATKAKSHIK